MELIKENEFFREFTIRILSSLNTKQALTNVYEYLKRYFPLKSLVFSFYDHQLGAYRIVEGAGDLSVFENKYIWPFPEKLWDEQLKILKANKNKSYLAEELYTENVLKAVQKYFPKSNYSIIILPICDNDNVIGSLNLRLDSNIEFDKRYIKFLDLVILPASISLLNTCEYQKVLSSRDEIIDSYNFLYSEFAHNSVAKIIGASSGLKNVMKMVQNVAPKKNPVLILGETGTGKELIANAIHFSSQVKNGPFIKVNCGAIPENLIDSELFGHVKGAFTGAISDKKGRFERADGGTIFLDEIGELPLQAQVRLLRVLQYHEIERVGSTQSTKINIRVIAATHRNLVEMVSENQFREDLWYRLNVFPIIIPPLRQRKEDIPALANFFVEKKSRELAIKHPPQMAPGELERLQQYDWYGNIRELENLVERELIMYQEGALMFNSLPSNRTAEKTVSDQSPPENGKILTLDETMAAYISKTLTITNGKIRGPKGAAELLGIKATTLEARMDKLDIKYGRGTRKASKPDSPST